MIDSSCENTGTMARESEDELETDKTPKPRTRSEATCHDAFLVKRKG